MKIIKKYWFIACFVVTLFVPLCTGDYTTEVSVDENRTLAKMTSFWEYKDGYLKFTKNPIMMFEDWFEDHVGLRRECIQIASSIQYKVFHELPKNDWLLGKENHWFYEDEERVALREYQNTELPTEEGLNALGDVFSTLEQQLQERDCEFVLMIAPMKDNVYPEYMPSSVHKIGKISRAEAQIRYLEENSNVDCIYMSEILLKHKDDIYPSFNQKYDASHWNFYGAYLGYKELMEHIKINDPEIYILEEKDVTFNERQIEESFYGSFTYTDKILEMNYNASDTITCTTNKPEMLDEDGSLFWHYTNTNPNVDEKRILICGDSMIYLFLLPLIAESYEELYFIHNSTQCLDKWIEYVEPECVVKECEERTGISYNESYNLR